MIHLRDDDNLEQCLTVVRLCLKQINQLSDSQSYETIKATSEVAIQTIDKAIDLIKNNGNQ